MKKYLYGYNMNRLIRMFNVTDKDDLSVIDSYSYKTCKNWQDLDQSKMKTIEGRDCVESMKRIMYKREEYNNYLL